MAFKFQVIVCVLVLFLVSSCDNYKKNFLEYRADFNPQKVDLAEKIIIQFADNNKLRVFNKDKNDMSSLSRGKNAFYIALYYKGDPLLSITNVGVAVQLRVSSIDYNNMPKVELAELTLDLINILQRELNVKFKLIKRK